MTGNNTKPMYSGNFLIIFWKYWDYAKGGTDYKSLEVVLLTNVLFMDLRAQWETKRLGCGKVKVDLCNFRS